MVNLEEERIQIRNIEGIKEQIISVLNRFSYGLDKESAYSQSLTADDLLIRVRLLAKIRGVADEVSLYIR